MKTITNELEFFPSSRTVLGGAEPVHLSRLEFAALQDVYQNGPIEFEDLQDRVWNREVGNPAIRAVCARVNKKLIQAGINLEISTTNSVAVIGYIS